MLLTELAEREASGEKAAIFAEMKHLGGVPMVALIFRHLATLPGGIEWTWNALAPAWRSGQLQESAWRIAREAPLQPIVSMPWSVLGEVGLDAAGLREIRIVLDAYNRANPENMLSVLCLSRLVEGRAASARPPAAPWSPPPAPGPLVAMGDVTRISPELGKLLDLVGAPGEPGAPRVVQSLYRHLLHRPAFLALAIALLRQRLEDGSIDRSVLGIRAAMNAAADRLVAQLSAPPAPHPGIRTVCARFGEGVIPQMIVVGRLLQEALPKA